MALVCLDCWISSLLELGEAAPADREIARFGVLAEALHSPRAILFAWNQQSARLLMQGHFGEAERLTQRGFVLAERVGDLAGCFAFELKRGALALENAIKLA